MNRWTDRREGGNSGLDYNYLAENARGFGLNFSLVVFDLSISSSIIRNDHVQKIGNLKLTSILRK